jgi:hypothetical protein
MTDRRNILGILAASIACCLLLACAAKAIGQSEAHVPDAPAFDATATLDGAGPSGGADTTSMLFSIPVSVILQLLIGWLAKRPWVRRHMPRVVGFLLRPLTIAIVALVIADAVMLVDPIVSGELTRKAALILIAAHVGQLLRPTLSLMGAPPVERRETAEGAPT